MAYNEENLRPARFARDPEAAKECAAKGGYASGVAKRKKRTMREAAQAILAADVPEDSEAFALLQAMGVEHPVGADLLLLAQTRKAIDKGDTDAARFIRDTAGEKPELNLNVSAGDGPLTPDSVRAMSDDELLRLVQERGEEVD